jgi:hypothetical protein
MAATPVQSEMQSTSEFVKCVSGRVPFVSSALTKLSPIHPDIFIPHINNITPEEKRSEIMVAMVRQKDLTGIIPHLIGRSQNPSETLQELTQIGQNQLARLSQIGSSIYESALETLRGGDTSIEALLALDKLQGQLVRDLSEKDTPKAREFRTKNDLALTVEQFGIGTNVGLGSFLNHHGATPDLPAHYFPITDAQGKVVVDVEQSIMVPSMPPENTQALLNILPDICRRGVQVSEPDVSTPLGFLLQLGKIGSPVTRHIIEAVKKRVIVKPVQSQVLPEEMLR